MTAPAVFHARSLWYESNPSVLTTALKCAAAKDPGGKPRPVTLVYLPVRRSVAAGSPHETTGEETQQVRDKAGNAGLYAEVRWFPAGTSAWRDLNGAAIADPIVVRKAMSRELYELYRIGEPVMFDWEKLPSGWIIEFLLGRQGQQGWKGKDGVENYLGANPGRPTAWTDASFQIGNYTPELLGLLDRYGFAFFCQLYYGRMEPVEEREDAIREIRDYGFPGIDVLPFYDAAHQPGPNSWRKGCLFTSNDWAWLVTP